MNWRNSGDLGLSNASRSTFLHTTFPQRSWTSTSRSPDVSFAHTGGLTGSPPQDAPQPMFKPERCTDGGYTCDDEVLHFSLIPELEPRSVWMSQLCAVAENPLYVRMFLAGSAERAVKLCAPILGNKNMFGEVQMTDSGVEWSAVGSPWFFRVKIPQFVVSRDGLPPLRARGVPRVSCRDPPVCGHIKGDVIAERQRAAVRLCVVRWLCRLQVRGLQSRTRNMMRLQHTPSAVLSCCILDEGRLEAHVHVQHAAVS